MRYPLLGKEASGAIAWKLSAFQCSAAGQIESK